jgi:very-short-patch-repair endonuclease
MRYRQSYHLDFAHVEGKVNIELDGPCHDHSKNEERDTFLRTLGWKVIRINHARE